MFMMLITAAFLAIYKVIYPEIMENSIPAQSTTELVETHKPKLMVSKPEVIFGPPLTEKEWEWIQASSKTMN